MNTRLFVMFGIWVLLHGFLYISVIRFFSISGTPARRAVLYALLFLSLSTLGSAVLVRSAVGPAVESYFVVSSLWAGFAVNLIMATVLCWVALGIARLAGKRPPLWKAAAFFYAAAALFSAYGVWNALTPAVTEVEAELAGLPEKWRGKKIVHLTDVHLGAVHTPERFRKNAEAINALKPDVIFITGDLFDSINPDGLGRFVRPLSELKAVYGVYYVNGNHENYVGLAESVKTVAAAGIRVLLDDVVDIDGLQVIGVKYPDFGEYRDVKAVIRSRPSFRQGAPSIILYHTPTNIEMKSADPVVQQRSTYWAPETEYPAARALGAGLQLSGHTHGGQMYPFVFLARRLYGKYVHGLNSDDGFSVLTSYGLGTFGPPMRTGTFSEIFLLRLKPKGAR